MDRIYVSFCNSEVGYWKLEGNTYGLTAVTPVSFVHEGEENQITRQAKQELEEYLLGNRQDFSVPLSLQGTTFQLLVWQTLQEIPYGTTVSYSEIAEKIGRPKAVRAVAQAIGKNPCLVFVPCHRVLGKNGSLTGFSAGLSLKAKLLHLESILP